LADSQGKRDQRRTGNWELWAGNLTFLFYTRSFIHHKHGIKTKAKCK